jgi:hypothetical protein
MRQDVNRRRPQRTVKQRAHPEIVTNGALRVDRMEVIPEARKPLQHHVRARAR